MLNLDEIERGVEDLFCPKQAHYLARLRFPLVDTFFAHLEIHLCLALAFGLLREIDMPKTFLNHLKEFVAGVQRNIRPCSPSILTLPFAQCKTRFISHSLD